MKKVLLLLLLLILRQQYALEREAQAIRAQKNLIFILSLLLITTKNQALVGRLKTRQVFSCTMQV